MSRIKFAVADNCIVNEFDLKMWEVLETWNRTRIFEAISDDGDTGLPKGQGLELAEK
jgi:hypothetical protein